MRFHFKFVICSQFVLEWWKYCHRHKKYCFELLSFYPSKLMNSCVYNGRNILLSLNATNMIIPSSSLLRYIILNQRDTFCYWARDGIFRFLFFLFQFLQMVWRSLNFVHDPSYQRHNKYCESVVNVHPSYQNVLVLKSHV